MPTYKNAAEITRRIPVLIYDQDGREGETDLVIPAEKVTPKDICMLRSKAGGLICVAIHPSIAETLRLPYMVDILKEASGKFPVLSEVLISKAPYGDPPSFSLAVNHKDTYTGITDSDRALTIRELAILAREALTKPQASLQEKFRENFRSPGHVPILIGRNNLLNIRRGHTELSLALAEMTGITPAMVICEMLDGSTSKALSKTEALKYAEKNGLAFIDGKDIVRMYTEFKNAGHQG